MSADLMYPVADLELGGTEQLVVSDWYCSLVGCCCNV